MGRVKVHSHGGHWRKIEMQYALISVKVPIMRMVYSTYKPIQNVTIGVLPVPHRASKLTILEMLSNQTFPNCYLYCAMIHVFYTMKFMFIPCTWLVIEYKKEDNVILIGTLLAQLYDILFEHQK